MTGIASARSAKRKSGYRKLIFEISMLLVPQKEISLDLILNYANSFPSSNTETKISKIQ